MLDEIKYWKVYLIRCADDSLYCGVTNRPIEDRIAVHNIGKGSKYTRARLPVTLEKYIDNLDKREAMRIEYKIKRIPRKNKISSLSKSLLE